MRGQRIHVPNGDQPAHRKRRVLVDIRHGGQRQRGSIVLRRHVHRSHAKRTAQRRRAIVKDLEVDRARRAWRIACAGIFHRAQYISVSSLARTAGKDEATRRGEIVHGDWGRCSRGQRFAASVERPNNLHRSREQIRAVNIRNRQPVCARCADNGLCGGLLGVGSAEARAASAAVEVNDRRRIDGDRTRVGPCLRPWRSGVAIIHRDSDRLRAKCTDRAQVVDRVGRIKLRKRADKHKPGRATAAARRCAA